MSGANSITADLLIKIPEQFPQIRLWRSNRVKAKAIGKGGKPRFIDAGIDGQADLSGIIGPTGRRLEVEIKAGDDRMRTSQKEFRDMILERGGVYIEARSAEGGLRLLAEAMKAGEGV